MKVCGLCNARFSDDLRTCPLDGTVLAAQADPLIGRTIGGRYLVVERIGAGGMATVYRAHHEVVGRDVALKFLAPELAVDPTARQRFLREARAANRIQHEHIISITDFGETEDGLVYLVMELLVGEPLGRLVYRARGPVDLARTLDITMQIASALGRAHELGVIHRDIKPDNVFLVPREGAADFVKLVDFGLAHMRGELRLTVRGSIIGTAEYMSPEHARGEPAGPGVDLYALGCVLFEMLTGRLPFLGAPDEIIGKHLRAMAPAPSRYAPNLPSEVDALVLALLAKSPAQRPRSAFQVYERLRAIRETLPTPLPSHSIPPQAKGTPTERIPVGRTRSGAHRTIRGESLFWDDRVRVIRVLLDQIYGGRDRTPPWIREVMARIEGGAADMARVRDELQATSRAASEREELVRTSQLQIGRALDELIHDEARALSAIDETRAAIVSLSQNVANERAAIAEALTALSAGPLDRGGLEELEHLGRWSASHLAEQDALSAAHETHDRIRKSREDIAFQIAQLKGRLGTIAAESQLALDQHKQRAEALQQELSRSVGEIVRASTPVVAHLMEYPHARSILRGDSAATKESR